jgi:hypothetical protein
MGVEARKVRGFDADFARRAAGPKCDDWQLTPVAYFWR